MLPARRLAAILPILVCLTLALALPAAATETGPAPVAEVGLVTTAAPAPALGSLLGAMVVSVLVAAGAVGWSVRAAG